MLTFGQKKKGWLEKTRITNNNKHSTRKGIEQGGGNKEGEIDLVQNYKYGEIMPEVDRWREEACVRACVWADISADAVE